MKTSLTCKTIRGLGHCATVTVSLSVASGTVAVGKPGRACFGARTAVEPELTALTYKICSFADQHVSLMPV